MNVKVVCLLLIFCFIRLNRGTDSTDFNQTLKENPNDNFDSYNNPSPMEEHTNVCEQYNSEKCGSEWFEEVQNVYLRNGNRFTNAMFDYLKDINTNSSESFQLINNQFSKFKADFVKEARKFKWRSFKNPIIKRLFQGTVQTADNKNLTNIYKINIITHKMGTIQRKGFGIASNKNDTYEKKADEWKSYHDSIGPKLRKYYIRRRNLQNIGAKENGYNDVKQFALWKDFKQNNFNDTLMKAYNDIFPLYQQLHALIRHCLWQKYPNKFDKDGLIPDHIFENLFPIIKQCYRSNVTSNINKEVSKSLSNMEIVDMIKMAENFFLSLGMFKMVDNFWNRSMFIKPENKTARCHPMSVNFLIGTDYRFAMCAKKNLYYFSTIHHEMGHLENFMAYNELPLFFQAAPNSGFKEAIGDTIELAVKTPEYLKAVGLIKNIPQSKEFVIDNLMEHALSHVVSIPGLLINVIFSLGAYNGSVPDDKLNDYFWRLNKKLSGKKPPVERSENDFDPGKLFQIAKDIPIVGYFFTAISKFTLYESMCKEAGEYNEVNSSKPLHRCNFYESKQAGKKLLNLMKQGNKQHWTKTMQILTGPPKPGESLFNGKSLIKYYQPLYDWLKSKNKELNIKVGW